MKKCLSIILAVMLVMSLGATAFAEPPANEIKAETPIDLTVTKAWKNSAGEKVPDELVPNETLKFSVTPISGPVAELPTITVDDLATKTADGATNYKTLMHIPSYSVLGCYKYEVREDPGSTQGVDYSKEVVHVEVWITNSESGTGFAKNVYLKNEQGEKINDKDCFTNIYNYSTPDGKYKNLIVDKLVEGNLANKEQDFKIKVTFTAEDGKTVQSPIDYGENKILPGNWENGTVSVVISNSHNSSAISFKNIPAGVKYEVAELDKHLVADPTNNDPATGYEVRYEKNGTEVTKAEGDISEDAANKIDVINKKGTAINTGVVLDSMPYVIMLVIAVAGVVLFTVKHRKAEE